MTGKTADKNREVGNGTRWALLGLLSLAMAMAYVHRVNLSVALADGDFKRYFHLSDADRGLLNSAFFWCYVCLQIPAGLLVDRYGVKYTYAIGFLLWSAVSAATGLVESVRGIVAMRVLLGVGESVVTPAGMRWIRFYFPENRRGLAVGIYQAAAKLGPALGTPLSAWLLIAGGWKWMFVVLGAAGMAWLVPWLVLARNDDRQIERKQGGSAAAIPFGRLMASPVMIGTIIGTFCYMYFVYFSMTWLPAYFVEARGLALERMGWYTGFSFGGMAAVATLGGWAADWLIEQGGDAVRVRKAFVIAGFLLAGTEVIGAVAHSERLALFFAVFSLSGLGLVTANYWALTQTLVPGAAVGRIVGVQNCAANIPGVVAPLLTGWLKKTTGGYQAPMHAIWVFLLLGILAYVFLVRAEYAPAAVSQTA